MTTSLLSPHTVTPSHPQPSHRHTLTYTLTGDYTVSPGAQRIPSHWTCPGHEPQFQLCQGHPPSHPHTLTLSHPHTLTPSLDHSLQAHGGVCYLRFDDTDPDKTKERYVTAIMEMVEWLGEPGHTPSHPPLTPSHSHTLTAGYKPDRVTFASDYFAQLHVLARELIARGHGFVCHQPPEALRGCGCPPSPWRDRPEEESLQLFEVT